MKRIQALDGRAVMRLAGGAELRLGNLAAAAGLTLLALVLMLWGLGLGQTEAGPLDLLRAALGGGLSGDSAFALIEIRLPRLLTGFLAGFCVAMTGAMLQSLAQNPLADPGLLGLSQGAMLSILLLVIFVPGLPAVLLPVAAMAGGLAVVALLAWLIRGPGQADGMALLLMGIAVETTLSSVTAVLILYSPPEQSYAVADWLAGSLALAGWPGLTALAGWTLLCVPGLLVAGRVLRVMELGNPMAMALGADLRRARPLVLVLAVALTSGAVAAVGPLAFLGVMAPHLAAFLSPSRGRMRLLLAGLTGGALVLAADNLGRLAGQQIALPIGLSLTILGVPLFVLTLRLRALARRNVA